MSAVYADLPLFSAWKAAAPARASRLRELLADGQWHTQDELEAVAGRRYGARLHEAKHGKDGGAPLQYQKRVVGGNDSVWEYRAVSP